MKYIIGFIFSFLVFCLPAHAQLTDVQRAELVSKNIFANQNPGFESGLAKWTATPAIQKAVGSNILFGNGGATWDSTSASQTMSSASVTMQNGLLGQNCEASILIAVPSGTATHNIQAFVGTDIISVPIVSSVTPRRQIVTFPCPATATTIRIRIQSVAANEPLIAFDDAYIGVATNVGTGSVDTPSVAYTPTFNSTTGHAASNGWWYRAGDRIVIGGSILFNGTGAASTVSVTVPSNCTIDLAKLNDSASYASLRNSAGYWSWYDDAGSAAVNPQWVRVVSATTLEFVNGSNAVLSNIFANNDRVSWTADLPCVGWVASTVVTANQQRAPIVTQYGAGSTTHTVTPGTTYLEVEGCGSGGAGSSSGTAATNNGGNGNITSFGTSLITANGGWGGTIGTSPIPGGAVTINAPAVGLAMPGATGGANQYNNLADGNSGGTGGATMYGGAGAGGAYSKAGDASATGSGSGGGGGGAGAGVAGVYTGGGGSAAGCFKARINNPGASYAVVVGAGATGGGAGTNGFAGGNSGAGRLTVTEYFGATTALLANSVISRDNPGVTTVNTIKTVTGNYTATTEDETIEGNTAGGAWTLALPPAASVKGKKYTVSLISGGNAITIDPNASETVCGQSVIRVLGFADSVEIQSNGTNWIGVGDSCRKTSYLNVTSTCSSTPCTITSQSGDFSAVTRGSAGVYTMVGYGTAYSSSIVSCSCSSVGANDQICTTYGLFTNMILRAYTFGGSSQDGQLYVTCTGPR